MVSENSFDFMTTSCRFLVKIYHRKKLPPTFYDWYMPWYVWLFQEDRGRLPLLGMVCPPLGIPSTEKKQTNEVTMIRCCVRQVVINMLYNIASKFVWSNLIARACFIFLLCTLMMSANKSLEENNFHQVENVIKQLVHTSCVRSSRYEALGKFREHSRTNEPIVKWTRYKTRHAVIFKTHASCI